MKSTNQLRTLLEYHQYDQVLEYIGTGNVSVELEVLRALALSRKGDFRYASSLTNSKIIDSLDADSDALIDWSAVLILQGNTVEAEEILQEIISLNPPSPLALSRYAYILELKNHHLRAIEMYEKALDAAPHLMSAWLSLVALLLENDDKQKACEVIANAISQLEKIKSKLEEYIFNSFEHKLSLAQLNYWALVDDFQSADEWLEQFLLEQSQFHHRDEESIKSRWRIYTLSYIDFLKRGGKLEQANISIKKALSVEPNNAELTLTQARLAVLMHHQAYAAHLFRRSFLLAEQENLDSSVKLAILLEWAECLLKIDLNKAKSLAERALALIDADEVSAAIENPNYRIFWSRATCVLASVAIEMDERDTATQLYDSVLAKDDSNTLALSGLGHIALIYGDNQRAIELFEQVKKIDPEQGFISLMTLGKLPEEPEQLDNLEALLDLPSINAKHKISLHFALANAYEKLAKYDKAINLCNKANALSTSTDVKYDPVYYRNRCAMIRQVFSKDLYKKQPVFDKQSKFSVLPVFVMGMPRSGTTLTEQIIAGHSQIFGAGELPIWPQLINKATAWEKRIGSGLSYPELVTDLTHDQVAQLGLHIVGELEKLAADEKPQAKFVVDKLPHNFLNIGLIKLLFPDAKIISVRRDPCDIALSNFFTDFEARRGGMGFAYDLEWIGEQLADHNLMMHHWNEVFPGEILEVQYEDVVEDTEGMARKMLEYIGVEWEPQVLAFNELDRPVKTASVWQVRQPIYKTSKAKWKRYEKHLGPLIKGTNAKITWEPFEMVRLPEPGMLQKGIKLYEQGDLDAAEYEFKKLLHHLPEHAAANHMVGIIYVRKGHLDDGIELMEKALKVCPWNQNWRKDLIQALEIAGQHDRVAELKKNQPVAPKAEKPEQKDEFDWGNLTVPNSAPIY